MQPERLPGGLGLHSAKWAIFLQGGSGQRSPTDRGRAGVRGLIGQILGRLFPSYCLGCRKSGSVFCVSCLRALPCGWTERSGLLVLTAGAYQGPLRRAVLRLKEANDAGLARALGSHLADLVRSRLGECTAVVGVPTTRRRRRWRGYCAPQRLAEVMAERLGCLLLRNFQCLGDPAPRKLLRGSQARRSNAVCFACQGEVRGRVVLVDDVVTSGHTLGQARQALLLAGAHQVEPICLASSLEFGAPLR